MKSQNRLLTGLQPSGNLTIGNYCGGIKQVLEYQNIYDTFMFVPDLHAITVYHDPDTLRKRIREVVTIYLACGVDTLHNHIYIQSENLYHTNLAWILECYSYIGEMSRMTQYKSKNANNETSTCGLFTYPILMAADILLYNTDYVPTGEDQRQHLELTRNIAKRFNNLHGEIFTIPSPLIPKVGAKIRDLQQPELKMSKSCNNPKSAIFLLDNPKEIKRKIMSAKTDSNNKIAYDEVNKPGISNLLSIYAAFTNRTIEDSVNYFEDASYGEFKKTLSETLIEKLTFIQEEYNRIESLNIVDDVLDLGKKHVNFIAEKMYEKVRKAVGLGR